jgi:hypothetical protein
LYVLATSGPSSWPILAALRWLSIIGIPTQQLSS